MFSLIAQGGDMLATLAVAASVFGVLWLGFVALQENGALRERLAAIVQRRGTARAQDTVSPRNRPKVATNMLRQLAEKLKLTRGDEAEKNVGLLTQAGWRTREALVVYIGIRLLLPCALTSIAIIGSTPFDLTGLHTAMLGAGVAIVATYAPPTVLKHIIKKRQKRFHNALPDALDLLMICAESGLGLDGAMHRVAREFRRFLPEMSDELQLTALELGFLPNRRDALMNLGKRVAIPGMRSLINTLVQTERYGTPLTQALRVLAAELREERMLNAEEKAAKLPAIMTIPMICFILPAMFIVLVGPAIIQVMKAFK
ncbi:MAG TPA: type II secretion system F family protein [Stellaceae bacterium]|nr:type II secretion system F family protein [Stellaceae bacterium]